MNEYIILIVFNDQKVSLLNYTLTTAAKELYHSNTGLVNKENTVFILGGDRIDNFLSFKKY